MFKSAVWDFSSKVLNQIISFVVTLVLARILSPEDFGIVGISLVFVSFSTLFLDLGFRNTLVYKQDCTSQLYSSVLLINLGGSVFLALLFYLLAPLISGFYKEPALTAVIRIVTILFIISSMTLVPNAINAKELRFKSLAFITVVSSIVSGAIAIWLAVEGWGLWSILARSLISGLLICILNWVICSWKFRWQFDINAVKQIWPHSSNLFIVTIMEGIFLKFDVLIIGKMFNSATVGYYTRAQSLDNISRELTSGTMFSVFLPYFSKIQDDYKRIAEVYKQCLHMVSFSILAISGAFFINSKDIFLWLFTEKWLPSATLYKLLTTAGFFFTINVVMNVLLCGIGKTREYLRLEMWKKAIIILAYLSALLGNIEGFLYLLIVAYIFGVILNMFYIARYVGISIKSQALIVLRYLLVSLVIILLCLFLFYNIGMTPFLRILTTSVSYLSLYYLMNIVIKNPATYIIRRKYREYYEFAINKLKGIS